MGYNESISELVSTLHQITKDIDIYKSGKVRGISITKASFKAKANTRKGELATKLAAVQADIAQALI